MVLSLPDKVAAEVLGNSQFSTVVISSFTRLTAFKQRVAKASTISGFKETRLTISNGPMKKLVYHEYTLKLPSSQGGLCPRLNKDKQVDWQDGAIAFPQIMNNLRFWCAGFGSLQLL